MNKPILSIKNIGKNYRQGRSTVAVLDSISLDVYKQDTIAITGASGAGKSTLLHIAGLLDCVDYGEVIIDDITYDNNSNLQHAEKLRLKNIGFIYQYHHLLKDFTACENVAMPLLIANITRKEAMDRATTILEAVGLGKRLYNVPGELSGGEQQRVAIARALINNPKLILADEPTGNLDPHTAEEVFSMFLEYVKKENTAIIMVSHNLDLASRMNKRYHLSIGNLVSQ